MKGSEIAIIIPSFNEKKNFEILLKDIQRFLPDARIVIVDDSPPDKTRELTDFLHREYPNTILISRGQKLGRGSAVLTGLSEALKDKNVRYLFEMDADLAHAPSEFERFLALKDTNDLVIGSRYMAGSNIVKWPLRRLVQSKVINAGLNMWLGLRLTDYTNGFRLYSRKAAEFLVKAHLRESGFIALSEIAYKLKQNGFRIAEVPISFRDRTAGASNANMKELVRSLMGAIRIRVLQ